MQPCEAEHALYAIAREGFLDAIVLLGARPERHTLPYAQPALALCFAAQLARWRCLALGLRTGELACA